MKCPKCGAENSNDVSFCNLCHAKLSSQTPELEVKQQKKEQEKISDEPSKSKQSSITLVFILIGVLIVGTVAYIGTEMIGYNPITYFRVKNKLIKNYPEFNVKSLVLPSRIYGAWSTSYLLASKDYPKFKIKGYITSDGFRPIWECGETDLFSNCKEMIGRPYTQISLSQKAKENFIKSTLEEFDGFTLQKGSVETVEYAISWHKTRNLEKIFRGVYLVPFCEKYGGDCNSLKKYYIVYKYHSAYSLNPISYEDKDSVIYFYDSSKEDWILVGNTDNLFYWLKAEPQ